MNARRLRKKPQHLYNFTGLSLEQFGELCEAVKAKACVAFVDKPRQRAAGGGRKAQLDSEN